MGFSKRPLIKKNSDEERIEWNEPLQAGELRKSQIITTFGPGAVVDLENSPVLLRRLIYGKEPIRIQISKNEFRSLPKFMTGI